MKIHINRAKKLELNLMKISIFYDEEKLNEVKTIKNIILSHKCDVMLYNDASIFQSNIESPHNIMKDITHIIFMYSDKKTLHNNFIFFSGYALGANIPIILISDTIDSYIPKQWLKLFTILAYNSFASFFEEEKKRFNTEKIKEIARNQLLQKGYSLFNSNYVQVIKENKLEIAKLFINAGFSPSEVDNLGTPVLSIAVRERHIDMVKLLIKEGANVNATSKDRNYTALMDAAQIGELEISRVLLQSNANPNTQSKDGQTALILAVGRQDIKIIDILLKSHSDYSLKDCMGMSSLDYANLFKNKDILNLFEEAQKVKQ